MTDEPAPAEGAAPDASRDRARIEPSTPAKKTDLLPILYFVGFVALGGALYFLWQNPPEARLAAQDAGKVDTLQVQVNSLRDAVTRLEQQRPPAPGPSLAEFQQLQAQLNAVATKPMATEGELQQLQQQMLAIAAKPTATAEQMAALSQQVLALSQTVQGLPKQQPDLAPLTTRVDALERKPGFDPATLDGKFAQVSGQISQLADKVQQLASKNDDADAKMAQTLAALTARVDDLDKQQKATAARAQLATRLQGAAAALAAGQKLGSIPGAPPALARFATEAPPTEASLRESFDKYAADAQRASLPAANENQDFAGRLWNRAQQAVTVRQGDRVIVGDPIAGILAHAKEQMDSGDLAGSVETLKGLSGAAAAAMKPWMDRATSLLEARAAIASMVTP